MDVSPTKESERECIMFNEAADASEEGPDGNLHEGDLGDDELLRLPDGGETYDWSISHQEGPKAPKHIGVEQSLWLDEHTKKYYDKAKKGEIGKENKLHNEEKYRPENAIGEGQMIILGSLLLTLRDWDSHYDKKRKGVESKAKLPKSTRVYTQGNPGTGKSFVIHAMQNMITKFFDDRTRHLTSTPTGCSAALVQGSTNPRALQYSCKSTMPYEAVNKTLKGSSQDQQYFTERLQKLFAHLLDESSMMGRHEFALIEERHATANQCNILLERKLCARSFGGLPFLSISGDVGQLPPVAKKAHYDRSKPEKTNTADAMGKFVIEQLLMPANEKGERTVIVTMKDPLRQDSNEFKRILQEMRDGEVTYASAKKIKTRDFDTLSEEEQQEFLDTALYVMPRWKDTVPVTVQYLLSLNQPCAKIVADYKTPGQINHCIEEQSFPTKTAMCIGAMVMLLNNFVVEEGLYNGAVGKVVDIIYENEDGPREDKALPSYVVVDFPHVKFEKGMEWDKDHPTYVPIPCKEYRCEKRCCSVRTVPLRVCKAITIYKSQGMTVGKGQVWERLVICLANKSARGTNAPGLELVAFSRAKELDNIAVIGADNEQLTMERLMGIGKSGAYEKRRQFEKLLDKLSNDATKRVVKEIAGYSKDNTLEGGYKALTEWYRDSCKPNKRKRRVQVMLGKS